MPTNEPKLSVSIDRLGDAVSAGRIEITVHMKVDGVTRVGRMLIEGRTLSPYTRALEWDDEA
ncbi:hypothetical protein SAMN05443245_3425 [Paraburkholderia fungorum]|uniref:Uncharacterized protein n=1 Tax=Paraburkholderia fungorum TaxID=134537 RepID=A0A1H1H0K8_9BURK|nr:hypothetical protein [Paraburkholderia fungorum]SDR18921.1 hypothetical protein SAMN05443245_3425 [Paraburkholderia fungorum]